MNILELFAGSRSIGKVAEKRGHKVFSSDIEQFGGIDYVVDILDFDVNKVPFVPDMIWASPPCTSFSIAGVSHHWTKDNQPKSETAVLGLKIVEETLKIINWFELLNSDLIWYVENPRGKLRKLGIFEDKLFNKEYIRNTVTYCQYGDTRMKPTDIWTNNKLWTPRKMCKNGDSCHVAAPRGSRTGTQGLKGSYNRSMIPEKLCEEIINSSTDAKSIRI